MPVQMTDRTAPLRTLSTASDEKLIKKDDSLFSDIPNLEELSCNQSNIDSFDAGKKCYEKIRDIGDTTSDVKGDKNIFLVDYLNKKKINELVDKKCPKDKQEAIKAVKNFLMTYTVTMAVKDAHYSMHEGSISECNDKINIFGNGLYRTMLTNAKNKINAMDFTLQGQSLMALSTRLYYSLKAPRNIIYVNDRVKEQSRLLDKITRRKMEKDKQEGCLAFDLVKKFTVLLNSSEFIPMLAEFALDPSKEIASIYENMKKLINDIEIKEANENAEKLLKEVEEESKKTSRKKKLLRNRLADYAKPLLAKPLLAKPLLAALPLYLM